HHYVSGLLSDLQSKDAESIAYLHDRERQGLQKFIGQASWDHRPLIAELAREVGQRLGEPGGVLVFDPSAFAEQGKKSVGVQRQGGGRLGNLESCQVGVSLGYVSREGHALVAFRLYLPQEWAKDRQRRKEAGVPREVRFCTRHELALQMLDEHGGTLPHGGVARGGAEGPPPRVPAHMPRRAETHLRAVPSQVPARRRGAPGERAT